MFIVVVVAVFSICFDCVFVFFLIFICMFFSFSCLCPHLILDDHYCCCCYCLSEVRLCWHLHHHHHHPIADLVGASVDVHLSTRANKHHYILTHPCYLSSHNTSIQKSVRQSIRPSKYVPKKRNKKLFVRANTKRRSQPTYQQRCISWAVFMMALQVLEIGVRSWRWRKGAILYTYPFSQWFVWMSFACLFHFWLILHLYGWTDGRTHNAYLDRPRNWRTGCTNIFMYFYLWLFSDIIS